MHREKQRANSLRNVWREKCLHQNSPLASFLCVPAELSAWPGKSAPQERLSACVTGWHARLLGHFLLFLCLFTLWPAFSLTCLFFFSILLWGEITFSGLNSHLIRFIFNQPLHPFLFASYFHELFLPFFPRPFLASSEGVSRMSGYNILYQIRVSGLWAASRSGCWEPGSAFKVRVTFSSAQVPACFKLGNSLLSSPSPPGYL